MEFEEFFRQSFDGAELTPSNKVWEHIEQDLNQNETPRYRLAVWWLSGLAAMVLLSFFAYLLLWNPVAPTYSASSSSVANNAPTTTIAENNNTTTPNVVEPNTKATNASTTPQIVQSIVETNSQKIESATTTNKRGNKVQSGAVKKYATTTQNSKNNFVANSKTIVTTDKNTVNHNNILTPLGTEEKASVLPLATQFNTLVPLPFQLLPFKGLKGEAILTPIQTPTSTPTPQVTNSLSTQKSWVAVQGFYGSYTPNFSNVQDSIVPNPYLTNSLKQGLYNYDQNSFAKDLNNLQGTTFSIGIEAGRTLWKGFGLKGGVLYTENRFEFNKTISAIAITSAALVRQVQIKNTTQQIGIPISAFYQKDLGKFTVGVHAGMQTDFLLNNTVGNSIEQEGHTFNFGTYKSLTLSGITGLQVGYQLMPRMQIFVESSYRQSLSSVYDTHFLQAQPSWFNVGSSLRYKF